MVAESMAGTKRSLWPMLNILILIAGIGVGGFLYHQHREEEKARQRHALPPIPKEQEMKLREAIRMMGRVVLKVTPEQEKKIEAIWTKMPQTLDEVADYQKRTDEILTPEQRMMVKPLRTMVRSKTVDRILEPARKRLPASEFEAFKEEIKTRVSKRLDQ